jgi:hypothetical protein
VGGPFENLNELLYICTQRNRKNEEMRRGCGKVKAEKRFSKKKKITLKNSIAKRSCKPNLE